jgi:hypothetical protein
MDTSAEKLVKQTIKLISKVHGLDYEEVKMDAKKVIRMARNYDELVLGTMEEIMDIGNVASQEELSEFSIETLRVFCRIKDISDSGSDKTIRARAWECIEEEFEFNSDQEDDDDDVSVVDSDSESEYQPEIRIPSPEPEIKIPVVPVPEKRVKRVKKPSAPEKEVVIIG